MKFIKQSEKHTITSRDTRRMAIETKLNMSNNIMYYHVLRTVQNKNIKKNNLNLVQFVKNAHGVIVNRVRQDF